MAPETTSSSERMRLARSPSTVASIVPWMGPSRGATIIAPITAAVESATTPAAAMIDESTSSSQKRESRAFASAPSMKTDSRICWGVENRDSMG